jgi:Holliday junction resolvase RusA-like endonuclease
VIEAVGFTLPRFGVPLKGRVKITITSRRYRKLDYDNYVLGCKPLVDAIKKRGYIVDDSPEYVFVVYRQEVIPRKETPETLITLEGKG